MTLKDSQLARLKYLLDGIWLTPGSKNEHDARFRQSLSEVESSEELHQFVLNYNWDDGEDRLAQVVEHPLSDQGTALLIFWLGEPWYFYSMAKRPRRGDFKRASYDLLKMIERKYLSEEFQVGSVRTDPSNIDGLNYLEVNAEWQRDGYKRIPFGMTWPSPGREVVRLRELT